MYEKINFVKAPILNFGLKKKVLDNFNRVIYFLLFHVFIQHCINLTLKYDYYVHSFFLYSTLYFYLTYIN